MTTTIHRIELALPLKLGRVNCYLAGSEAGWVLVDSGPTAQRARLEAELARAGCTAENLRLILITHGDFDHTGNAAYLRGKFGAKIAMHPGDAGMSERGDMFWNRSGGNALIRAAAPALFGFGKALRFSADVPAEEGFDLNAFGLEARVISIPGHSSGSIGVLTGEGDLFCGDLLDNTRKPALNSIMDNLATGRASLERLKGMGIRRVYPGHGEPFEMAEFVEAGA